MRSKRGLLICFGVLLFSCSGIALDGHYVLDPLSTGKELRGKTSNDDLPLHACDPVKKADGTLDYTCIAFFYQDYQKLLDEVARLQTELKTCQQGH